MNCMSFLVGRQRQTTSNPRVRSGGPSSGRSSERAAGRSSARWRLLAITLLLSLVVPLHAGEHIDTPTAEGQPPDAQFISTEAERRWYGVTVVLRDYRPGDDSVLVKAWPQFGFTTCHDRTLRLSSPAGQDLAVPTAPDHLACMGRVPAAWVRDGFTVRLPMFNAPDRHARLDVAGLDLQRLRVEPAAPPGVPDTPTSPTPAPASSR
jgi:hypothetical protein